MEISQNFVAFSEYMNFNPNVIGGGTDYALLRIFRASYDSDTRPKKGPSTNAAWETKELNQFPVPGTHLFILKSFCLPILFWKLFCPVRKMYHFVFYFNVFCEWVARRSNLVLWNSPRRCFSFDLIRNLLCPYFSLELLIPEASCFFLPFSSTYFDSRYISIIFVDIDILLDL